MKRRFIFLLCVLMLVVICILLRKPFMKAAASFLIYETDFNHIETTFVLSGGAFDRGNKAAELFLESKTERIICTGANQPPDFKALNIELLESELTYKHLVKEGVPDSLINLIKEGTSTLEESKAILQYCLANQLDSVLIVSSKFHTRRIKQVFVKPFKQEGITVFITGAPSSIYNEMQWWENEYGLIALNNEYLKQIYYLLQ